MFGDRGGGIDVGQNRTMGNNGEIAWNDSIYL